MSTITDNPIKDEAKKSVRKVAVPRVKKAVSAVKSEEAGESIPSTKGGSDLAGKKTEKSLVLSGEYIYARGRRKTAVAKTKLFKNSSSKNLVVNGQPLEKYFKTKELVEIIKSPLKAVGQDALDIDFVVSGGGPRGQAESCRLGISRALIILNPDYRTTLKALGFLMRDPREKERKKYGLKKARRAPQWGKR